MLRFGYCNLLDFVLRTMLLSREAGKLDFLYQRSGVYLWGDPIFHSFLWTRGWGQGQGQGKGRGDSPIHIALTLIYMLVVSFRG